MISPSQPPTTWTAGDRYEPYVGRWGRLVAPQFLARLKIPAGKRWLDVGCGVRTVALLLSLGCGLAGSGTTAWACACCTNQGQRTVGVAKLDSTLREDIGRLRFMAEAELYTGERDTADIKGIANPSGKYEIHVSQEPGRWVFAFADKAGRKGTLALAIPATVAVFAVDPRLDEREGGTGPSLFKEWKLTSNASGTGIFTPGMGSGQRITLIVQAHGNNCTSPDMATHWTLMVHGPKADYHFFGKFVQ